MISPSWLPNRSRVWRATAAALLVTALIAGCASNRAQDMAPDESKAELDEVVASIEAAVPGPWENSMSQPLECRISRVPDGVQWTYGRTAKRSGDREDARIDTERVAQLIEDAGCELRPTTVHPELGYDFSSNNGLGSEVAFGANENGMSITAGSICAPGGRNDFTVE